MQGQTKSISFDGREIRLTTGRYAPQAGGSVMVECGDTAVLVTATQAAGREGIDFLPLICDCDGILSGCLVRDGISLFIGIVNCLFDLVGIYGIPN